MSSVNILKKNEKGQTALETAIILIAFIVVASVFAFTIFAAANEKAGPCAKYSNMPIAEPYAGKCGFVAIAVGQNVSLKNEAGAVYLVNLSMGSLNKQDVYAVTITLPGSTPQKPLTYTYGIPTAALTDTIPNAVGDIAIQRVIDANQEMTFYVRFFPSFTVIQ